MSMEAKQPDYKPKLGWFVYILVMVSIISGFLFGYNTTIVSPAMLYVVKNVNMEPVDNSWHELIIAITPGMGGLAALFTSFPADKLGRKPVIIISSIIFALSSLICAIAFAKWVLLVGRISQGVSSMTVPIYISESSPAHIRGILVTSFHLVLCFGQVFANAIGGVFSYIDPENIGWRLMFGFSAIPAALQFIGFLFLTESPRNLYARGRKNACEKALMQIYNDDTNWVRYEYGEIEKFQEKFVKETKLNGGEEFVLKRIIKTKHVFRALIIGCALQIFQQLSGVNTIMYYTGNLIKSTGVKSNHDSIWASVGVTSTVFFGNIVPMFTIEKYGRRKLLISTLIVVFLSSILLACGFLIINKDSSKSLAGPDSQMFNKNVKDFQKCIKYSNCDYCVTDESCGFCAPVGSKQGYCLPKPDHDSDLRSTTGYCSSDSKDNYHWANGTKYEWADVYCHTKYTVWPIVCMVVFLFFITAAWTLNSEFYPLWARGTGMAISTFCNGFFNLLVSVTFLSLTEEITKFGAYFMYSGVLLISLIVCYLYVPETKGVGIDEIEMLFMTDEEKSRLKNDKIKDIDNL